MANRKLGNLQNLGNLGNIILSFRFCPGAKIKNSDLKISEKNFRDFRVFDLASNFPRLKETIMTPLLGHEIGVYSNLQPRNSPPRKVTGSSHRKHEPTSFFKGNDRCKSELQTMSGVKKKTMILLFPR